MKFGLIGDGNIARRHKEAIRHVEGELAWIYDPIKYGDSSAKLLQVPTDCIVICSPSHLHREHIKTALDCTQSVIVEKPLCLPWEPIIDDDRINVVLQCRYLDLPESARGVTVKMVRDFSYFNTWKGNSRMTGGIFFNLFIHYIDMAIKLGADFIGRIVSEGSQVRMVDNVNLLKQDIQMAYNRMYEAILQGKGIKPADIMYLHYVMEKYSHEYGFGRNLMNKTVEIPRDALR